MAALTTRCSGDLRASGVTRACFSAERGMVVGCALTEPSGFSLETPRPINLTDFSSRYGSNLMWLNADFEVSEGRRLDIVAGKAEDAFRAAAPARSRSTVLRCRGVNNHLRDWIKPLAAIELLAC